MWLIGRDYRDWREEEDAMVSGYDKIYIGSPKSLGLLLLAGSALAWGMGGTKVLLYFGIGTCVIMFVLDYLMFKDWLKKSGARDPEKSFNGWITFCIVFYNYAFWAVVGVSVLVIGLAGYFLYSWIFI